MSIPADYPDHQAATVSIATDFILGTPLVGQSVAAGASQTIYNGQVNQTSYAILIDALGQASPVLPFGKLSVIWKDAVGGNIVDIQHWFILVTNVAPAGSNGLVVVRGPTTAGFVTVLFKNYDSAAVTIDAEFLQSSRVVTRHDARNANFNISGSYTAFGRTFPTPVSDCAALNIGSSPLITVPASGAASRINGLYTGEVAFTYTLSTAAANLNAEVQLQAINPDFATPTVTLYDSLATSGPTFKPVSIPFLANQRCLLLLNVFNNDTVNSLQFIYALTGQEFSS